VSVSSYIANSQTAPPPPPLTDTISNHERNILRDLELIEKTATQEANGYLREAEGAVGMQRGLAKRVSELEVQMELCDVAVSTAEHLKEDVGGGTTTSTAGSINS
jgi:hypothetical protein